MSELYLATNRNGHSHLFVHNPRWDQLKGEWVFPYTVASLDTPLSPAPGASPVKVKLMPAEPTEQDEALIIQRSCGAEALELLGYIAQRAGQLNLYDEEERRINDLLSRHNDAKGKV